MIVIVMILIMNMIVTMMLMVSFQIEAVEVCEGMVHNYGYQVIFVINHPHHHPHQHLRHHHNRHLGGVHRE